MDYYQFYFINDGGSILRCDAAACSSQAIAIENARARLAHTLHPGIEVWLDGIRLYGSQDRLKAC